MSGRHSRLGGSEYRQRLGDYSVGRWAGDVLFLSGVVGATQTGDAIRGYGDLPEDVVRQLATGHASVDAQEGPIVAQAWTCFTEIERILTSQGLSWAHVVKLTHYMTNIAVDFPAYHRVRSLFLPTDPPGSTVVEVTRLLGPDLRLEVEAVACRTKPVELGPVGAY